MSGAAREEVDPGFAGAVHGTSIVIDGRGVLIRGPSGAGKSDLALRLIDRGASLLSDDYTYVLHQEGAVIGRATPSIAGLIEVRGLGIMTLPFTAEAPLALVVRVLTKDEAQPERMPDALAMQRLCGIDLPVLPVHGLEASAPIKIELALRRITGQSEPGKAR